MGDITIKLQENTKVKKASLSWSPDLAVILPNDENFNVYRITRLWFLNVIWNLWLAVYIGKN